MPVAKALDKRWLGREIDRELRKTKRQEIVHLRGQIRLAIAERKNAIVRAREHCKAMRLAVREHIRERRAKALAELRQAALAEREAAKAEWTREKTEARSLELVERRRAEYAAEVKYQAALRRSERANRQRHKEHPHAKYIERRGESDDEVRQNLPAELVPLFERVKRGIRATPRMSRTEAMLHYAETHPREYLEVIEDRTDAMLRDLERKHREASRPLKGLRQASPRYTPEQLAEVPF